MEKNMLKDGGDFDAFVDDAGSNFLPRGQMFFIVLKKPQPKDSTFNGKPTKIFEVEAIDLDGKIGTYSVTASDYKKICKQIDSAKEVFETYKNLPLLPYVRPQSQVPFNSGVTR